MTDSQQAGARKAPRRSRRLSPSAKAVIWVSALPLLGILFPTCVVIGVSMLPTFAAYLFDRSRDKYLALTAGMLNFCGSLPAVAELWARGHSLPSAMETLGEPLTWLFAYGAAGVGWLIYLGMPPIVSAYYAHASETQLRDLLIKQKELAEVWGEEVRAQAEANAESGEDAALGTSPGTSPAGTQGAESTDRPVPEGERATILGL